MRAPGRRAAGGAAAPRGPGRRRGEARRRRPPARRFSRRRVCRFRVDHTRYIDFKAYRMLRDFVTERGKMIPRRISGNCAKHQRMLSTAVKRARVMALLGFTHR
ncbi:30S ribosomal protein S18 [bacterium]|nr:30S ribosomal protein S18 [bacterium]